ncbi:tripartite tricarboxylate transporter substrate binding protein [Gynuella sunshinyii]|uniref:Tricarboxylate transport protein TctC n=1 Tax=Gynuella sunshinyii YC6258 TaxID=1445510 RepID=A0A0C5W4Y3_9GAMM|nr:tripartite tricarboxylate transporter substrate binding protein [Gynuella sunshinyii]AJQ97664.1 hypothetical protein YC6258_05637 [Gynuella sunshinyii YC6258]
MRRFALSRVLVLVLSVITFLGAASAVQAGKYPNRPVKFIVPWPPGDLEDVLTRAIAKEMSEQTGVPATVVNKPGGGGVLGATTVAQSRPDGSVIGSFVVDLLTTAVMSGNSPYNVDDFEPVGIFLDYPFVIAAKADAPYSNLQELAEYSKSHDVVLGHFGYQALPTALTFKAADQMSIKFASDAAFDELNCATLANGDADIINTTTQQILPCLESKDVKLLVSITRDRLVIASDVPTLKEVTGIEQTLWNGLFVKKGTDQAIKDKIAAVAHKALQSDDVRTLQQNTGAGVYWADADAAAKTIAADYSNAEKLLSYMNR